MRIQNIIVITKNKKELFEELKEKIRNENININLYLGNEAYISENYIDLIKQHEIMTINNTRYLLLEFPLGNMFRNTKRNII